MATTGEPSEFAQDIKWAYVDICSKYELDLSKADKGG